MSPVVLYFVFWWPVSKSRNTRVERLSLMVYLPGSVGRTRRFVSFLWVMECPREHIILLKVFYSYCCLFLGERIISTSISSHEICGVTRAYSLAARSCAKNIWSDHDDCHPHFTLGWLVCYYQQGTYVGRVEQFDYFHLTIHRANSEACEGDRYHVVLNAVYVSGQRWYKLKTHQQTWQDTVLLFGVLFVPWSFPCNLFRK